jgi:beta-lactamase regulating signal transducer with metallopeptidase domain
MTMVDCFITVLNMSLSATWAALLVMLVRIPLRRAPKVFSYALWGVVLFRMVCPVSFEGAFSLTPVYPEAIPKDIVYAAQPQIQSGITVLDQVVNQSLPAANPVASANPVQIFLEIAARVWIAGGMLLLIWSVFSYLRFRQRLGQAVREEKNIFSSDRITTAFVLGFFRPRIYLPLHLEEKERRYILCHEQVHIRRGDHWIKATALLALFLHWFNPVLWLSYRLMCRDMEMSCDERVMDRMGEGIRRDYSNSLLSISMRQNGLVSPLAFGENDVSGRIKNVLHYRKPAFWVILALLAAVLVLAVCLAANPLGTVPLSEQEGIAYHDNIWGEAVTVVMPGKADTYTLEDPRDIEELSQLLSSLEVTRAPVSRDQSESRLWDFSLTFQRPMEVSVGNFTLYFTAGSVWSGPEGLAYGLEDKDTSRLLQALEEYAARVSQDGNQVQGGYYVGFCQVTDGAEGPLYAAETNDAGTRLASLLLSGTEVPGEVGETPPVESYLLIQMGDTETIYYTYEDQGRFYMEKQGDYRLELDRTTYDGILEVFREVAETAQTGVGSSLTFYQTDNGEVLSFSLDSPELAAQVAELLQGEGDAQVRQEKTIPEGVRDFLRIAVGENVWYLYREGDTVWADDLATCRVPLPEDSFQQLWNIYIGTVGEAVSQSASRFTSQGDSMEEIARDGILGYYGAFGAEDLPEEIRLEDFQIQELTPMAGNVEEFAVSVTCSYWTPVAGYWISANGNSQPLEDGSWLWFDCYQEFRFRRTGDGEYQLVESGTGGVAQGLAALE